MLDRVNLILSNLRYILFDADILSMRFALNIGSIFWAFWVVASNLAYPNTLDDFDLPYVDAHLQLLAALFATHGIIGVTALLLHQRNKILVVLGSMYGALLWTISLNIIVLVRASEHTLPMGGAHWLVAIIAWWIFIRDAFGREISR